MELLPEPVVDEVDRTVTIAKWGGWLIQVSPISWHERLMLTPEAFPQVIDYSWWFPKGRAAAAAGAWDPETEPEPAGHIRAVGGLRQAGEAAQDPAVGLAALELLLAILGTDLV